MASETNTGVEDTARMFSTSEQYRIWVDSLFGAVHGVARGLASRYRALGRARRHAALRAESAEEQPGPEVEGMLARIIIAVVSAGLFFALGAAISAAFGRLDDYRATWRVYLLTFDVAYCLFVFRSLSQVYRGWAEHLRRCFTQEEQEHFACRVTKIMKQAAAPKHIIRPTVVISAVLCIYFVASAYFTDITRQPGMLLDVFYPHAIPLVSHPGAGTWSLVVICAFGVVLALMSATGLHLAHVLVALFESVAKIEGVVPLPSLVRAASAELLTLSVVGGSLFAFGALQIELLYAPTDVTGYVIIGIVLLFGLRLYVLPRTAVRTLIQQARTKMLEPISADLQSGTGGSLVEKIARASELLRAEGVVSIRVVTVGSVLAFIGGQLIPLVPYAVQLLPVARLVR